MERYARAPEPLSGTGDMKKNWINWKEEFFIFLEASGYIDKPSDQKAVFLMNLIGKVGLTALQNSKFVNPNERKNLNTLLLKLDMYFDPPKTEAQWRYNFFTTSKKSKDSIESYIKILQERAQSCNFGNLTNTLIRDQIILQTNDKALRNLFLTEEHLNLQKIINIYNEYELTTAKMKNGVKQQLNEKTNNKKSGEYTYPCWRCNTKHAHGCCPAYRFRCCKCNDMGHYSNCCKKSPTLTSMSQMPIKPKKDNSQHSSNSVLNHNQNMQPQASDWTLLPLDSVIKSPLSSTPIPQTLNDVTTTIPPLPATLKEPTPQCQNVHSHHTKPKKISSRKNENNNTCVLS